MQIFADIISSNSRSNYDLRYQYEFSRPLVKSVFTGTTETISYFNSRIWDLVTVETKQKKSLTAFKKTVKTWNPHNSPCRLCKKYVADIRFMLIMIYNVFSETLYIEGSFHKETTQLIFNVNRLIGFCGVQIFLWEVFFNRL